MRKKEQEGSRGARTTPLDIQQVEFRIARFRGYKERDVDEFLDRLTEDWTEVLAENQRLRAEAERLGARGASGAASVGVPDLDDVARQADEIIARARDEAAAIVREAEERAAVAAAGPSTDRTERAAISAFLRREKEFLQELVRVAQGHAERVKAMADEAFATPPPEAEEVRPDGRPEEGETASAGRSEPTAAELRAPIRVDDIDEPEPATVAAGEDDERPGEGDRSLRELFWGEE
jgi:DivIVA domain-containing protein